MTRILRLAVVAAIVAWLIDRRLAAGARRGTVPPIDSLVVVDAPIERVWAEIADVEGQPRWMHDLKSVRLAGSGPVGRGTRAYGLVRIMGIPMLDPITITDWDPPHRFAISHDGTFRGSGTITLEPSADGSTTIVRWRETLVPPLLPHLGAALARPILRDIFQADLHRLRAIVEA